MDSRIDRSGTTDDLPTGSMLTDAVIQQLPVAMVVAEAPTGRLVTVNGRVEAIWGHPLAAERVEDYGAWGGLHPDGTPLRWQEWPLARSLCQGETVEAEEIEIVRGDGEQRFLRVDSAPVYDSHGRIVAAVATLNDITSQRREESARRFLSEASAVLSSSLDYPTTLRNLAQLVVPALADWCSVDVLREEGDIQRLVVEHRDPARAALAQQIARRYPPRLDSPTGVGSVLRTGEPLVLPEVTDEMLVGVAQDPEHLNLLRQLGLRSAMLVPLTARGRVLGAISMGSTDPDHRYSPDDLALVQELATRAALAIDNARLHHEVQAASRAKSDFLAVISHELRTPLTAIIGYSELLELGIPEPVTERQREHVERIELSARHLLQLIEEILTAVTLESRPTRIRPQQIQLWTLLEQAEVIIRPMATAKGLDLLVEQPEEDVLLVTDPDKILQVLLNLLSNAVKFTEQGEIRVTAVQLGDRVEITVRDTGIGMAPLEQAKVFEPFWQAEQPITRRAGGTGLGLTITRRLLDLLGGDIQVQSTRGQGSTFTISIPLRLDPDLPAPEGE